MSLDRKKVSVDIDIIPHLNKKAMFSKNKNTPFLKMKLETFL